MPNFWYLSNVSLKILSYFYKPKNMTILGCFRQFWDKKSRNNLNSAVSALIGRGMRTCLAICKAEPWRSGAKRPRLKDSSNPYFFAEEENRHLMMPVFLLAEV